MKSTRSLIQWFVIASVLLSLTAPIAALSPMMTSEASAQTDFDGDGVDDSVDNCIEDANADQVDTDLDASGDACDLDDDNDLLSDLNEVNVYGTNPLLGDGDGDWDGDEIINGTNPNAPPLECGRGQVAIDDVCVDDASIDADGDGLPDYHELISGTNPDLADSDGDGLLDSADPEPLIPLICEEGFFLDGASGECIQTVVDSDNDGIEDSSDNCPEDANPDQADTDDDGTGDACEPPSVLVTFQVIDATTSQPMPFPGLTITEVLAGGSHGQPYFYGSTGTGENNSIFEISLPAGNYSITPGFLAGHVVPPSFVQAISAGTGTISLYYYSNSGLPSIYFRDNSNELYPLGYPEIPDACVSIHEGTHENIGAFINTYCDGQDLSIDGAFAASGPVLSIGSFVAIANGVPGYIAPAPFNFDNPGSTFTINVDYEQINTGGPYEVSDGGSLSLTAGGRSTLAFNWDLDNNGSYEMTGQNLIVNSSAIGGPGEHTIKLFVCNELSVCGAATTTVEVTAAPNTQLSTAPVTVSGLGGGIISVTFAAVNIAGTTTASLVNDPASLGSLPSGFTSQNALFYDISTDANYVGPVNVCLSYSPSSFFDATTVQLFHHDGGWVPITISNDSVGRIICGETDHLSPFAVGEQEPPSDPGVPTGTTLFVHSEHADGESIAGLCYSIVPSFTDPWEDPWGGNGEFPGTFCDSDDSNPEDGAAVFQSTLQPGDYFVAPIEGYGLFGPEQSFSISADQDTAFLTFSWPATPAVQIRAIDADDNPSLGFTITANGQHVFDGPHEFDGVIDIYLAGSGTVDLSAIYLRRDENTSDFVPETINWNGGETVIRTYTVTPQAPVLVTTLVDSQGDPVAGGCFRVFTEPQPGTSIDFACDETDLVADGTTSFYNIPSGTTEVLVKQDSGTILGYHLASPISVSLTTGETSYETLSVQTQDVLVFTRAVDAEGNLIPGACYYPREFSGGVLGAYSGETCDRDDGANDGITTVSNGRLFGDASAVFSPGDFLLIPSDPVNGPRLGTEQPFVYDPVGGPQTLTFVAETSGVEVTLVGPDGESATGACVTLVPWGDSPYRPSMCDGQDGASDGFIRFYGHDPLADGTYSIVETKAPTGYPKADPVVVVLGLLRPLPVTLEHGPPATGSISALVQGAGGIPAEFVQVGLYATETTCDQTTAQLLVRSTDASGIYLFKNVEPGDYCVLLGWFPTWFDRPDFWYQPVTVTENDTTYVEFTFATHPTPPDPGLWGLARLYLRSGDSGLHLLGGTDSCVELSETQYGGQSIVCDTDHYSGGESQPDSIIDIYVQAGTTPTITSYTPPLMWRLVDGQMLPSLTVDAGEVVSHTLAHDYNGKGTVSIVTFIPDTTFTIVSIDESCDEDGVLIDTVTTNENGQILQELDPGTYCVIHLEAPAGYELVSAARQQVEIETGRFAGVNFELAPSTAPGNLPPGSNVTVSPDGFPNISVRFQNVTQAGELEAEPIGDPHSMGEVLNGYATGYHEHTVRAWSLTTTAVFSGQVQVCVTYDPAHFDAAGNIEILLHDGVAWQYSGEVAYPDESTVCGYAGDRLPSVMIDQVRMDPIGVNMVADGIGTIPGNGEIDGCITFTAVGIPNIPFSPTQVCDGDGVDADGSIWLDEAPVGSFSLSDFEPPDGYVARDLTWVYATQLTSCSGCGSNSIQINLAPINTPLGPGTIELPEVVGADSITVTFTDVTSPGATFANGTFGPESVPSLPAGYSSATARIYEIKTTALFTSLVAVCVAYDPANFADAATVELLHHDGNAWNVVTTSNVGGIVCGTTTSLGFFALAGIGEPLRELTIDLRWINGDVPIRNQGGCIELIQVATGTIHQGCGNGGGSITLQVNPGLLTFSSFTPPTGYEAFAWSLPTEIGMPNAAHRFPIYHQAMTMADTPTGSDVTVQLGSVSIAFSDIGSPGDTTVEVVEEGSLPPMPSGFTAGTGLFFEISTTASYTPPIEICLPYNPATFADPMALELLHFEGGAWAVVTTTNDGMGLICGLVSSLSPFGLAESTSTDNRPMTITGFSAPVNMYGVTNTVKGGSTVPLQFEIFQGGVELTDVAAIAPFAVTKTSCHSGAALVPVEFTSTGGTTLRYANGHFQQNWKTPKSPGCYTVVVTTVDGESLKAYFQLK